MPFYRFRGRGQLTAPTSRSGRGYNYAGRSVKLKGENFELTWNGPALVDALFAALEDAFSQLSDLALEYMQRIVPVDTGRLRDSCFVTVTENGGRIQVIVGADTPYAVYIELGTYRRAATPYIRPTYDFIIKVLPGIVRTEVKKRGR